jgi:outer membrane receptor for ferrienterochelin and colicins
MIRDVFRLFVGVFVGVFMVVVPSLAQDLSTMGIEELLHVRVVTASKSEESLADAPGIVTVISKDELRRFGGTTLKDVLERVPGLVGSSVYMTDREMIAARGDQTKASGSHIALLINGRPCRESHEGGINTEIFETFPVNVIERIEVVKGPGSVLYGTNAVSAVINIITEKVDQTEGFVSAMIGDAGAHVIQGDVKVQSGDFRLVAAGRTFERKDWQTDYAVAYPGAADVEYPIDIPGRGPGFFFDASFKNLSITSSYNKYRGFWASTNYMHPSHPAFNPAIDRHGDAEWEKRFVNVGYRQDVTDRWEVSFDTTYTNSLFETHGNRAIKRDGKDVVAELTNYYSFSDTSKLVVGGLYGVTDSLEQWYSYDIPMGSPATDVSRYNYALYAQADHMFTDKMKGILGFQLNKIEFIDVGIVPRAGLIFHPSSRVYIKALYSEAFKAPSNNEIELNAPSGTGTLGGNPDLKPEKVRTWDLAIGLKRERSDVLLSVFRSEMRDVIYQTRPLYSNGPGSTSNGFELEGQHYFGRKLYVKASTLYHHTEGEDGNENITPIPRWSAKAGVSYESDNGILISLSDNYQGRLSNYFTDNAPENEKPGAYNILNLHFELDLSRLLHKGMNHRVSLVAQVDNVLDEEVWLPCWGKQDPYNVLPYIQGISFYAGVNALF